MNQRGRPRNTVQVWEYHIHLRLRVDQDDDLIKFLKNIPPRRRASALKSALRAGGMQSAGPGNDPEDDEFMDSVDAFLK